MYPVRGTGTWVPFKRQNFRITATFCYLFRIKENHLRIQKKDLRWRVDYTCNENIRNAHSRQEIACIFRYVSCLISVPDIRFHFVFPPPEYRSRNQSNAGYTLQLTENSALLTILRPILGTAYTLKMFSCNCWTNNPSSQSYPTQTPEAKPYFTTRIHCSWTEGSAERYYPGSHSCPKREGL